MQQADDVGAGGDPVTGPGLLEGAGATDPVAGYEFGLCGGTSDPAVRAMVDAVQAALVGRSPECAVGFVDDLIKIRRARNLGLNKTAKTVGILAAAVLFGRVSASRTRQ